MLIGDTVQLDEIVCDHCGQPNRPGVDRCAKCSAPLRMEEQSQQKYYWVLVADLITKQAELQLGSDAFQFFKRKFSGQRILWFEVPYESLTGVSLADPHLVLCTPKRKRIEIAFRSQVDAEEALLILGKKARPEAAILASSEHKKNAAPLHTVGNTEASSALRAIATSPESMRKAKAHMAFTQMVGGAVAFAIGLIVTMVTFERASQTGGLYIVAWGAIVFGPIVFLKGLFGWLSNRDPGASGA